MSYEALGGVIADAKSRYKASGVGSQEKKYINVAKGWRSNKDLDQIAGELEATFPLMRFQVLNRLRAPTLNC